MVAARLSFTYCPTAVVKKINTTADMSGADVIAFPALNANRKATGNLIFDFIGTATFSSVDQI